MKAIKVRVSVGATINLGNYESLKIAYDVEAELAEGDSVKDSIDKARDLMTEKVREDLEATAGGKKYLTKSAPASAAIEYDDDIPF